jgi:cell wall-associated NlpC family hydrolase
MRKVALAALLIALAAGGAQAGVDARIGHRAARFVGLRSLHQVVRSYPDDCSGFVELVAAREGLALRGSSSDLQRLALRRHALRRRAARRGDLVFFRNTWDRDRNGSTAGEGITHVGIVDSVSPSGAVTFVHRARSGIIRSRLDLRRPRLRRDARGKVHNDVLRRAGGGEPPALAGELFAGFAAPRQLAR